MSGGHAAVPFRPEDGDRGDSGMHGVHDVIQYRLSAYHSSGRKNVFVVFISNIASILGEDSKRGISNIYLYIIIP